jgi:hypothetical protein
MSLIAHYRQAVDALTTAEGVEQVQTEIGTGYGAVTWRHREVHPAEGSQVGVDDIPEPPTCNRRIRATSGTNLVFVIRAVGAEPLRDSAPGVFSRLAGPADPRTPQGCSTLWNSQDFKQVVDARQSSAVAVLAERAGFV